MLGDHDTIATIAVKDLQVARDFYEGVLGFAPRGDSPEGVLYGAGPVPSSCTRPRSPAPTGPRRCPSRYPATASTPSAGTSLEPAQRMIGPIA